METIKILAVKCKDNYFITDGNKESYRNTDFKNYFINSALCAENTFHEKWFKIPCKPEKIQIKQSQNDINYRFELMEKSLMSEKIPNVLEAVWNSGNYCYDVTAEYSMYKSLYELKSDKQPDIFVDVPFEFNLLIEVENLIEKIDLPWEIKEKNAFSEKLTKLEKKDIQNQILDKIVFPEIVLLSRPCSLSSHESYEIIRQYIKKNINHDVASITSDYNFCFTVKKRIKMTEKKEYTVDVNRTWLHFKGQRRKKPKYEKRYNTHREIECFEMTYSPENYRNYTPIEGFRGNNLEDLKNNIDDFLKNLIEWINEPLEDCPHCKGMGIIIKERETNA